MCPACLPSDADRMHIQTRVGGLAAPTRPRFPQLKRRTRKIWLTLHVGVSVGWLGLALAMMALALAGAVGGRSVRHGAYEFMHLFDLAVIIPSVILTITSGLAVSLGTPWGLVRHRWVLLKFVISLIIPITAMMQSTWIRQLEERTRSPAGQPGRLGLALVITAICYLVLLWTAVILSIHKPGGKTGWGRDFHSGLRRPRPQEGESGQGSPP